MMRFTPPLRRAMLCLATVATAACGSDSSEILLPPPTPPEPVHTPNFVKLQSDPGDYVGAGHSYDYSQANAVITLEASGNHVRLGITGDQWWNADFQGPSGQPTLQPGSYTGLQRYPFNDPGKGGLSWGGDGRGCNLLTGSFTVDSVTYAAGVMKTLDLRFEQHCEGMAPALHGEIHWRADDKTAPPGPVSPVPAGLWQPPASALPATGNYAYIQSDPGDYIGRGQTHLYAPPTTPIGVTANGPRVSVSAGDFRGEFEPMNTLTQLKPGYYAGVTRWPFQNPVKGGLDWSGDGRGCNNSSGWFAVDQVTYSGTTITALDLRFEQHCENGAPALHGAIHWHA